MRTRTRTLIAWASAAAALATSAVRADVSKEAAQARAASYASQTLIPFIEGLSPLKATLAQANAERADWAAYAPDWKAWTPADAERRHASYAYAEYRWSARKDRSFRLAHMTGPLADALRSFQKNSQGSVAELFITDAKGGNVVQTQPTSDWFQGDEPKFVDAARSGEMALGEPQRDDTVGKVGVHVSLPVFDEQGGLLGVAIALVVVED